MILEAVDLKDRKYIEAASEMKVKFLKEVCFLGSITITSNSEGILTGYQLLLFEYVE